LLLNWHDYKYYPYERDLAVREVATLFNRPILREIPGGLELKGVKSSDPAGRLTYFSIAIDGPTVTETPQSRLESAMRTGKTRQATRYSVHGLHEYKGKFNPQVLKALLNIFGIRSGERVLDPFCGSGTTLIECAHSGVFGRGVDLNPFAVFLANAKLHALVTPAADLRAAYKRLSRHMKIGNQCIDSRRDSRIAYLRSWFTPEILRVVEMIRVAIEDSTGPDAPVFLAFASDLLRDYSLQDPKDLRIRRRRTSLPDIPFSEAFSAACTRFFGRLEATQTVLGPDLPRGRAERGDHIAGSLSIRRSNNQPALRHGITVCRYSTAFPHMAPPT